MVLRKKTKRLAGTGPPLGHLANQPIDFEIHKEVEEPSESIIQYNRRSSNPDSSMGPIRSGKGKKSNQPLPEDLRTPTPRGPKH